MAGKYHIVLTTCPTPESAETLANALVDRGLAGCVNILPAMRSIYYWKGKRESGEEHLLLIKSRVEAYTEIEQTIMSTHPYELPEIIAVSIDAGLDAYLTWIDGAKERDRV
ncbi:MAG: divalent-cation tolerance protein CutA [Gammaproteobacteria bacterium]|nr:divalent-cation tolerance protein CutA [Gammaproteobacteria bacterium]